MRAPRGLSVADLVALALLTSAWTTVAGYEFGGGNQVSQLPIVLRAIDPGYLTNDAYVNWGAEFGPRAGFATAIAAVASEESLPAIYLALTFASNLALAIVSGLFARTAFHGSNAAALTASFLVLSAETFELGYTAQFGRATLIPTTLVQPLLVGALWAAFAARPLLAAALAGAATIVHPVLGPETGVVALGLAAARLLVPDGGLAAGRERRRAIVRLLAAAALLAAFFAPSALRYAESVRLGAGEFVAIETLFRNPHHALPRAFPIAGWILAGCFLLATGIAWLEWRRDPRTPRNRAVTIAGVIVGLVALCAPAFVFVEHVPVRAVAVARPFRLLLLVKLLGLLLVAGAIAERWTSGRTRERGEAAALLVAALSPVSLAIVFVLLELRRRLPRRAILEQWTAPRPLLAVALVSAIVARPDPLDVARFALFGAAAVALALAAGRAGARAAIVAAAALGPILLTQAAAFAPAAVRPLVFRLAPKITLDDWNDSTAEVARFAREHTAADAVFLTPPSLGEFRLLARRAIVVDTKSFPYQDAAMKEWYERLVDCYGGGGGAVGREARRRMKAAYAGISDEKLDELGRRYGASHAVLQARTPTTRPGLFANRLFRVVSLSVDD